jgi:hypothetical protein
MKTFMSIMKTFMGICLSIALGLLVVILSRIEPFVQGHPQLTIFDRGLFEANSLVLMVGLVAVGFLMTFIYQKRAWLWPICLGIVTFLFSWNDVILSARGLSNIWPIELAIGAGCGLAFSSLGVVLALVLKGKIG